MKNYLLLFTLCFLTFSLHATIRLPNILSSNMVLQQKSRTKLWGWASPGEKITITASWNSKAILTSARADSTWQVNIRTPKAGGPYTIRLQGQNTLILDNILVGEVWLASGQSNMEWSYNNGLTSIREEFPQLSKLNIRLLRIPKTTSETARNNVSSSWTMCDSNTLKAFSAVAYYYGKQLNKELNVPIGLISSNWGGTPAEVWTPAGLVERNPELKDAAAKNKPTAGWPVTPGYTYNAMIAPLTNYKIAGAIWYQGESNREAPWSYAQLMSTMIGAWRKAWNTGFPFYYVQIAPYNYERPYIGALVREAQAKNLSIKRTGMVVVSDLVDDTLNIHPRNKKDVGLRLANLALAKTYHIQKTAYESPVFRSFTIRGSDVVISFDHAEEGLTLKGESPKELYIAGSDKMFYPAALRIEGSKIVVSSEQVKSPVAVRYQFSNAGIGNLFSKSGLPVAPFRTDDWGAGNGG